jgi:DNA-directed RNA polymerase subunit M/transcription elongation factor TFIIS
MKFCTVCGNGLTELYDDDLSIVYKCERCGYSRTDEELAYDQWVNMMPGGERLDDDESED